MPPMYQPTADGTRMRVKGHEVPPAAYAGLAIDRKYVLRISLHDTSTANTPEIQKIFYIVKYLFSTPSHPPAAVHNTYTFELLQYLHEEEGWKPVGFQGEIKIKIYPPNGIVPSMYIVTLPSQEIEADGLVQEMQAVSQADSSSPQHRTLKGRLFELANEILQEVERTTWRTPQELQHYLDRYGTEISMAQELEQYFSRPAQQNATLSAGGGALERALGSDDTRNIILNSVGLNPDGTHAPHPALPLHGPINEPPPPPPPLPGGSRRRRKKTYRKQKPKRRRYSHKRRKHD